MYFLPHIVRTTCGYERPAGRSYIRKETGGAVPPSANVTIVAAAFHVVELVLDQAGLVIEAWQLIPVGLTCELYNLPDESIKAVKAALETEGIKSVTIYYV